MTRVGSQRHSQKKKKLYVHKHSNTQKYDRTSTCFGLFLVILGETFNKEECINGCLRHGCVTVDQTVAELQILKSTGQCDKGRMTLKIALHHTDRLLLTFVTLCSICLLTFCQFRIVNVSCYFNP